MVHASPETELPSLISAPYVTASVIPSIANGRFNRTSRTINDNYIIQEACVDITPGKLKNRFFAKDKKNYATRQSR